MSNKFIEEKVNEFEGLACFHEVPIDALAKIELRQFMVQSIEQAYTQGKREGVKAVMVSNAQHADKTGTCPYCSNNITLEKEEEVLPDNKE